jgi:hypothetical protein
MKNLITLSIILLSSLSFAQTNTYQNAAGSDYWKNRKPHEGYWQQDVHYQINATINDQEESVAGVEKLTYYNNSPDTLYEVFFHLYQNAFTPNSYAHKLRESGKIKTTFGEHEAKGEGTHLEYFKLNGKEVKYSLDNTILKIELGQPILPNGSVNFEIKFKTFWDKQDGGNMRRRMKTFAHNGVTHFDGVHWYPRICVYDRKFGWTTDQHLGKEFYGDFGMYEVELTFPNQYIVEATGDLTNENEVLPKDLREAIDLKNYKASRTDLTQPIKADGSTKTWKYKAVNVHDFAFTADPTYRMGVVEWNGVKCVALAQEKNAHKWQQTAAYLAKVVEVYSNEIGMYGYPKIVAADARDGMEYPMLTLNSGNWPGHQYVIAHEVGHNWFFGMVGNNETYRSGLDEGFTQFLTALSLKKISNQDHYNNHVDKGVVYNRYLGHAANENNATLNIHADHYNSADRHGGGYSQVYFKTATMLYNLEYVLGDELFSSAMKNYFSQWQYCHPYWEDFRTSVIRYTKVDLNWFFDQWIESTATIDYKVGRIKQSDEGTTISIQRKTTMQMPLDVLVEYKDGSKDSFYIPNTYFTKKTENKIQPTWIGWDQMNKEYNLKIASNKPIKDVTIDPSGRLADINRLNNSKKTPVNFKFSKYRQVYDNYTTYQMRWHPNVWYNGIDGIKAGVDVFGRFHSNKHQFNTSVWYNTGLGANTQYNTDPTALLSYRLSYKNRIGKLLNLNVKSKFLDGLVQNEIGVDKYLGKNRLSIYAKSNYRSTTSDVKYLINNNLWKSSAWNNTLNLEWGRSLKFYNGNGSFKMTSRGSFLNSDYNYARINGELKRNIPVKKATLRTRLYAQYGSGKFAPESQLMLAGGNNEDMMDNAWVRSVGIVPMDWNGYSGNFGHLHYGGGLNLRGYSGYRAVNTVEGKTAAIFGGTSGLALNVELDFTKYLKLERPLPSFRMNTYLFGDAGWLDQSGFGSGLRADAGLGVALTKNFGRYNYIKPVTIRADFPFFVNRLPSSQTEYFDLRYVIGISRAF